MTSGPQSAASRAFDALATGEDGPTMLLTNLPNSYTAQYMAAPGMPFQAAARPSRGLFASAVAAVDRWAGGDGNVTPHDEDLVDTVMSHHTKAARKEILDAGKTRPDMPAPIMRAPFPLVGQWPHTWLYTRVFLWLVAILAALMVVASLASQAAGFLMIIVFAPLIVPLTIASLFFELNITRDTAWSTLALFFLLGVVSLPFAAIAEQELLTGGVVVEMSLVAIIEEATKIICVCIAFSATKKPLSILGGMAIGAAVGAGMAGGESSVYAINAFITSHADFQTAFFSVAVRAFCATTSHAMWAMMEGGALALATGEARFQWKTVLSRPSVVYSLICVVLHAAWDILCSVVPSSLLVIIVMIVVFFILSWIPTSALISRGLDQARDMRVRYMNATVQIPVRMIPPQFMQQVAPQFIPPMPASPAPWQAAQPPMR